MISTLLALTLCGCDAALDEIAARPDTIPDVTKDNTPEVTPVTTPTAIQVIDMNGDVHETSVNVIDAAEAEDDNDNLLPAGNLASVASDLEFSDEYNYAYNGLNESARTTYTEIYTIITEMLEKVELSTRDEDEVDLAFRAVMVDHPEIFYVRGYSIGKYMSGKSVKRIVFSGTYTMDSDSVARCQQEVDDYVSDIIAGCPSGGSDFDRIKYVYDYLIRNNVYDTESVNNQNILSVVENGRTVCQGYTKMMQLVLGRMGMFCTLVNGKACGRNGVPDSEDLKDSKNAEWGGHVWNIVKCNGMFYNVDVTWGDAAITLMNNDGTLSSDIDVNYEFFLVDDEELLGTHEPKPVVTMPVCDSMEDNYYNHEGVYFTQVDSEQLQRAFESALSKGETHMFIKAASDSVFESLHEHLFDRQNVFKYLGRTNVRYVEFEERNLMMFSL